MTPNAKFKQRVVARERLLGAFHKTPHPIAVEVMALAGFDFLVLDAEHAPFDRTTLDSCLIASRALNIPAIVRIPDPSWALNTLDAGAAGLMIPHVETPEQAAEVAQLCNYAKGGGPGVRGFAGTSRAAAYGLRPFAEHLEQTQHEVTIIAQIEDPKGVENVQAIAATPGIDALFVGRADLAVSHGLSGFFDEEVSAMTDRCLGVETCATGLYCAPGEDTARWTDAGASLFVVGSDHSLMLSGGKALRAAFDG